MYNLIEDWIFDEIADGVFVAVNRFPMCSRDTLYKPLFGAVVPSSPSSCPSSSWGRDAWPIRPRMFPISWT